MQHILAADLGATHSRFALFRAQPHNSEAPLLTLLGEQTFAGADYPSFTALLHALFAQASHAASPFFPLHEGKAAIAVLAPAGPVQGEVCRLSNLPWVITAQEPRDLFRIPKACLINDFAAQAYACLLPHSVNPRSILAGEARRDAPVAVMGAGTGLGKALLLCPPEGETTENSRKNPLARFARALVLPSEGGHAEFPFAGEREFAFAQFAAKREGTDRLIGDAIVSGAGLAHLVAFITKESLPPREATARAKDCPEALEWFARFYARACRNFVLDTLALGGLYITGGMALRLPVLTHPAFAREFRRSAVQGPLLAKTPVWHVQNPQAGLWGAALYGLLKLTERDAA